MPFTPKVGQTIKLTGKITSIDDYGCHASFDPEADNYRIYSSALQHAELVSEPEPTCSKEFAELLLDRINNHDVYKKSKADFMDWLDTHTE